MNTKISQTSKIVRLGVNIDHVATIRNARGEDFPSPTKVAILAIQAGADIITAHLREDQRHINKEDIIDIKKNINKPLNLEISSNKEIVDFAITVKPKRICLVPENRQEITTESGLLLSNNLNFSHISSIIECLHKENIQISLFIDPDIETIKKVKKLPITAIELHTGRFCNEFRKDPNSYRTQQEFEKITQTAKYISSLGIECHAGHGLNYQTAALIAKIPGIVELNIGHFIISQAIFSGIDMTIKKMKASIN